MSRIKSVQNRLSAVFLGGVVHLGFIIKLGNSFGRPAPGKRERPIQRSYIVKHEMDKQYWKRRYLEATDPLNPYFSSIRLPLSDVTQSTKFFASISFFVFLTIAIG